MTSLDLWYDHILHFTTLQGPQIINWYLNLLLSNLIIIQFVQMYRLQPFYTTLGLLKCLLLLKCKPAWWQSLAFSKFICVIRLLALVVGLTAKSVLERVCFENRYSWIIEWWNAGLELKCLLGVSELRNIYFHVINVDIWSLQKLNFATSVWIQEEFSFVNVFDFQGSLG